jgi:hypothetical protein
LPSDCDSLPNSGSYLDNFFCNSRLSYERDVKRSHINFLITDRFRYNAYHLRGTKYILITVKKERNTVHIHIDRESRCSAGSIIRVSKFGRGNDII